MIRFKSSADSDVLQANGIHVQAPIANALLDDPRNPLLRSVPLGKEFIQRESADDVAQGGLGVLGNGECVILDLNDGLLRVRNQEEQDSIDGRRHVIFGDHLLTWNIKCEQPKVDESHVVNEGDDVHDPRASYRKKLAQSEHDTPFPLGCHTHTGDEDSQNGRKHELDHGAGDRSSLVQRPQDQKEHEAKDDNRGKEAATPATLFRSTRDLVGAERRLSLLTLSVPLSLADLYTLLRAKRRLRLFEPGVIGLSSPGDAPDHTAIVATSLESRCHSIPSSAWHRLRWNCDSPSASPIRMLLSWEPLAIRLAIESEGG